MKFIESTHSYFNEGVPYTSVTSYLGKFVKPKDWNEIAKKYLEKRTKEKVLKDLAGKWNISYTEAKEYWKDCDMSVEWLRGVWASKSNRALEGGSSYHNYKEILDSKEVDTVYNPVVNDQKEFLDLSLLEPGKTYLELGVYSHLHKLMGQIDKVKITKERTSRVRDYKTNEREITPTATAYYDKSLRRKVVKRLLPPVSHLPEIDYYKYALQLSMYAYLLELHGIKNESLHLDQVISQYKKPEQVTPEDIIILEELDLNRIKVFKELREIKLPYLKEEIKNILKLRQSEISNNGN